MLRWVMATYPPVHPHGRGEHAYGLTVKRPTHGSSPRAWGTPVFIFDAVEIRRFIPTGVGNTCKIPRRAADDAVHPHGRGEHSHSPVLRRGVCGSSPRAWGTPWRGPRDCRSRRFIPTGVGNTLPNLSTLVADSVHPHGRGEHAAAGCGAHVERRFIPTGVGNTLSLIDTRQTVPVHPHGRGEHSANWSASCCVAGSSPRAWGTPKLIDRTDALRRFIPTGVGNTHNTSHSPNDIPVHPHGRGEHPLQHGRKLFGDGSSPRAWGTRPRCRPAA